MIDMLSGLDPTTKHYLDDFEVIQRQFEETYYEKECWVLIKMPNAFYQFMTDILSAYQNALLDKIQVAMRGK